MPLIQDIILAPAMGAFFYDDQAAIRAGVSHDGFDYLGTPQTPGFERVRQPATALSIGLLLDDGVICWGDMVSVQYSGAAGRDPLFEPDKIAALAAQIVKLVALDPGAARSRAFDRIAGDPITHAKAAPFCAIAE